MYCFIAIILRPIVSQPIETPSRSQHAQSPGGGSGTFDDRKHNTTVPTTTNPSYIHSVTDLWKKVTAWCILLRRLAGTHNGLILTFLGNQLCFCYGRVLFANMLPQGATDTHLLWRSIKQPSPGVWMHSITINGPTGTASHFWDNATWQSSKQTMRRASPPNWSRWSKHIQTTITTVVLVKNDCALPSRDTTFADAHWCTSTE